MTTERVRNILCAYIDDDICCSETWWVKEKLMETIGVTKAEMFELGLDWMLTDEEE